MMENDALLTKKCQSGSISAFEEIVKAHRDRILKLVYRITGNFEDANDISQEVFIRAYESIKSLRGKYTWSKDGGETYIINRKLLLMAISVVDGGSRQVVDLKELDMNIFHSLCLSPDGGKPAFGGWNRPTDAAGGIFVIPVGGGGAEKFAFEDSGDKSSITWSPDGKWISYSSDMSVKVRPEGIIWEADVGEVIEKRFKKRK